MTPSEISFTNTPNCPSTKPPHDLKFGTKDLVKLIIPYYHK